MSTSKMFSTFLTLIIIMMMIFAGCNISPPAKQGLYGDTCLLTGTMTYKQSEKTCIYTPPSTPPPTTIAYSITLEFRFQQGDYLGKTATNELGKFLITLKPEIYDDNQAKFFIATATSGTRKTRNVRHNPGIDDAKSYYTFRKVPYTQNTYHLLSAIPDQAIKPQCYLTLNQEKFTQIQDQLYIIDQSNFKIKPE